MDVETIYESLMNGQREQMVDQINEYGPDFWEDYKAFFVSYNENAQIAFDVFTDAVISYFRITTRWEEKNMSKNIPATACNNCGACNKYKTEHAAELEADENPFCKNCGGELRIITISEREAKARYLD